MFVLFVVLVRVIVVIEDSFNCEYFDVCDQDCLSCPYFKAFLEVLK
jgi:hypothetical protein